MRYLVGDGLSVSYIEANLKDFHIIGAKNLVSYIGSRLYLPKNFPSFKTKKNIFSNSSLFQTMLRYFLLLLTLILLHHYTHSDIINDLPTIQECPSGKRFIVNHILFVCHQFGERRSFRPFGGNFLFDSNTVEPLYNAIEETENSLRYIEVRVIKR
jgi:hypothetical protein